MVSFWRKVVAKKQVTVPFFIPHQGCPHRCAFCAQWPATGAARLPRPADMPARVDEYLGDISPTVEQKEIAFFGGSFTGLPPDLQRDYLTEASALKKEKRIDAIRLSTRPDYIDHERLDLLEEYSVDTVEIGAQSFHDHILERSRRGHSAAHIRDAAALIRDRGFDLVIQLMPGLPGDTRERSLKSAKEAAALSPSAVRLYPAVVLAGTELEEMLEKDEFTPLTIEEAVTWGADQYALFKEKGIPVIRMGLHPFSDDQLQTVIAGPYHVSLGFFIKSRYRRNYLEEALKKPSSVQRGKKIEVRVPPRDLTEYIGHRRENVTWLCERFGLDDLVITAGGKISR